MAFNRGKPRLAGFQGGMLAHAINRGNCDRGVADEAENSLWATGKRVHRAADIAARLRGLNTTSGKTDGEQKLARSSGADRAVAGQKWTQSIVGAGYHVINFVVLPKIGRRRQAQ